MNKKITVFAIIIFFSGCAYVKEPFLKIIETQPQLVRNCSLLGVVAQTSDADRIVSHAAWQKAKVSIKERAIELGATHIVWLHNTKESVAAEAYRCPVEGGAR